MSDLERELAEFVAASGTPGGVVAWSLKGGPIGALAAGVDGHLAARAMTVSAPFRVASLTKIVTGLLTLRLVDDGRLGLDESLEAHLPSWPGSADITVRHLLAHRSGIAPQGNDDGSGTGPYVEAQRELWVGGRNRNFTLTEVLDWLRDRPLLSAPGAAVRYSNTNSLLLARIAELVTGRSYVELLRERIIDPLGLRSTWYPPGEAGSDEPVAGRYRRRDGSVGHTSDLPMKAIVSHVGAAGGLVSNAPDLVALGVRVLRDHELLSDRIADEAFTIGTGGTGLGVLGLAHPRSGGPLFPAIDRDSPPASEYVGFGGSGGLPGTSTKLVYLRESDTVLVLLLNRSPAPGANEFLRRAIAVFQSEHVEPGESAGGRALRT